MTGEDLDLDLAELASALSGNEDGRRLLALGTLLESDRRGPLPGELLGPLLDCLGHARKTIQRTAADALALWSRTTPAVRTSLASMLRGGDFRRRWGAAFALAKIGPEPATLPVLIETLGEADGDMRWAAAAIVVELAKKRNEIREELAKIAASGTPTQRKMAIYCLRDAGGAPVPLLAGELGHEDPGVRLAALSALAHQRAAGATREVIQVARSDPDPGVRRAAVSALGRLAADRAGEREIAPVLDEAEASADEGLRKAAAGARRQRGERR